MAGQSEAEELHTLEVFEFISAYLEVKGISPTLREIAEGCLMSKGNLEAYLGRLEGWLWIERQYRIPRSIRRGAKAPSHAELLKLLQNKRGK